MKLKFYMALLAFLLIAMVNQTFGQELAGEEYVINLKSGSFTPPEEIATALGSFVKSYPGDRVHVLMQFRRIPDSSEKNALQKAGINILNYIPQNTWFVSVPTSLSPDNPALSSVRWIGRILPEDKVAPAVRKKIDMGEGKIDLVIKYFSDVDAVDIRNRLEGIGATILGETPLAKSITISIPAAGILGLASEDPIRWIEPVPPPARGESYRIRAHVQSDLAQSTFGLSGSGVTVGIFEDSHAYGAHPDLSPRTFQGDTDVTNYYWHATNVAGVIGGDGDVTFNYRGMAPGVKMYSYDYSAGATTAERHANYLGDLQTAITTHNIDIANNSWGSSGCDEFEYGAYLGLSPTLDGVVRGDFGKPITVVYSAGNERYGYGDWDNTNNRPSDQHCITDKNPPYINYGTLNHPKSAKNPIVVGAVDSANNKMTVYSAWGPTDDGRIKPDIVASGHHNGTDRSGVTQPTTLGQMYSAPYYPTYQGNYGSFGLTSCAAAATSGSIALLLEDFRNHSPVLDNPLPSTIKALLIHSAMDLDDGTSWHNKGPDYASGFGLLHIKDAIDLKRSGSFNQSQVGHGEEKSFLLTVPAGAWSVKVTLVWDDEPGAENASPVLVNDLNLYVVDDQGVHHHPWTLDPNNPANPADRQTGNIPSGVDHRNNVEQVVVDLDGTGKGSIWRAFVKGYNVPQGPQKFSIVAKEVREFKELKWYNMPLGQGGGDSSLVLDSDGNPHIAHEVGYWQNPPYELKYTWKSGGTWHSETITSGRPVAFTSLGLDSNGNPHMVYQEDFTEDIPNNPSQNILTYATKINGSWVTEQLTGPTANPIFCSLAVDRQGNPHIAYAWLGGALEDIKLKYIHKYFGIWYTEEPDPNLVATYPSIALDSQNRPHIAYNVAAASLQSNVKYARKIGASWVVETVDDGGKAHFPSLTLSSAGTPHIVYHEQEVNASEYGNIKYAWRDGVSGQWLKEVAIPAAELGTRWGGTFSSMAVDSNNVPHIAYNSGLTYTLKYARKIAGSWIKETADDFGGGTLNVGLDASLALDSRGIPHIAYQVGNTQSLRYAFVSAESAQSSTGEGTVTFSSNAGQMSSVTAVSEGSLPVAGKPTNVTFPFGFFSWKVTNLAPGQMVTFTISYPSNIPSPVQYWKVINGVWTNMTSLVGDDDGDNILTLTITDGGLGDADNLVNGEISDPGGIGVDTVPPAVTVTVPQATVAYQDGMTLQASATDISGVAGVYYYVREPGGTDGISTGNENLAATFNPATNKWEYNFDTTKLQDGNYLVLVRAIDNNGNEGWSDPVPFSIRNWAIIALLPSTPNNKAGRTMPVKFALRVAPNVDPLQPFVENKELQIKIFEASDPQNILQASTYGFDSTNYRIDPGKLYITNFKTLPIPAEYVVEVWRPSKNFRIGSFTFKTSK